MNNKILISEYKVEKFYFSGESLYSEEIVDTDSTSSGIKIVNVWGSWCAPCIKNLPKLVRLKKAHETIEFIGICLDRNKEVAVEAAEKVGMTWKNIFLNAKEKQKIEDLNILAYPTYIVLKNNEVIDRFNKVEDVEEALINLKVVD